MAKHSTNHGFHKWAQRRSTEALAALVAQYAPRRAAALLAGRTYSSGSPVLDLQLAAAAAELDRRRASEAVAEAAVVGMPHEIKGQGICTFVTLQVGTPESEELREELVNWVRKILGPVATPDALHWAPALPKTRSGKIMRRILRKIAANELDSLGDTSTLAEPQVVEQLIATVYGER